ncbi:hypothetical protein L1987_37993 [Smallanthus sonchifolius]|uniref:Uncharacterized protein n=1 Tax=Smallanthus sonchifolius TaxID=185202 RepID=A0ACB9HJ97_9ASTR|nr:hypothetical protein L1987_37993 [Smallanthus sonchifolius]
MSGKALDPEFKEIEDEEKELETDIVDSLLKEIDDAFDLNDNGIGVEGLDKHLEASSEVCNNKEVDITAEGEKGIEKQLETTSEVSKNLEANNKSFEEKANESGETDKLTELSLGEGLEMNDKGKINVGKHKIKIDCAIIHQLLGVLCGKVTIESMTKLKIRDKSVKAWRNRYPGNFMAPTEIVNSMRGCKKRWKRNDRSMPFSGPLVILTVEGETKVGIENGGFGKGKYKRLTRLIEDEVEGNSGYSVVDEIEGLEKLLDVFHKQKKLIDNKLERLLEKHPEQEEVPVMKEKYDSLIENDHSVGDDKTDTEPQEGGNDNSGDTYVNVDVENVEEKDSEDNAGMIDEDEKGPEELNESDTIGLGHRELGENHTCPDTRVEYMETTTGEGGKQDRMEPTEEIKDTIALKEDENVTGNKGNKELASTIEYVYDGPDFSIGLTQLESNNEDLDTEQMEERNSTKKVDGNEGFVIGEREENVLKKRDKEYLFTEDGMLYKLYGKKKTKQEKSDERKLETDNDRKCKGNVGIDDEIEIVFSNNFNLEVEKFRFITLNEDTKVFNKVIDAWSVVLNFEEKYRSPTSPYRLFCDTDLIFDWMLKDKETDLPKRMERFILNMKRVVDWNPPLMDLRGTDMVLLPMIENDHYYLIVFELKHPGISVIDNFSYAYPLVRLNDHEDYFQKDSAYKVVKHSKTDVLNAAKIKKDKIAWATTSNALDCAVFVMRHMKKIHES